MNTSFVHQSKAQVLWLLLLLFVATTTTLLLFEGKNLGEKVEATILGKILVQKY